VPEETAVDTKAWRVAWDLVTEAGEATAHVGIWTLENMGAVMVSREGERTPLIDDDLHQKVAHRLREHGQMAVRFEVNDGVVHLHGKLGSRVEAGEVVHGLLDTPGVEQIVSHLGWPGSEQKPLRPRMKDLD
jgi:hypothetical protein